MRLLYPQLAYSQLGRYSGCVDTPRPGAWRTFWQNVFRLQKEKINPWIGLRNTIGVAIPLIAGAAFGNVTAGVVAATGALNVAFRDSGAPYAQRARQMLLASAIAGLTVFTGGICGRSAALALAVIAAWTFAAGMLVSIGDGAADVGTMSVVILVIYAANPMQLETAVLSGLAAFAGGLLQTALATLGWPFHRYSPERHLLGNLYFELARTASQSALAPAEPPPATAHITQAQAAIEALGRDRSAEGDRYRFLMSQAERIRVSVLTLQRIRARLSREQEACEECVLIDRALEIAAASLDSIGRSLQSDQRANLAALPEIDEIGEKLRAPRAQIEDARFQVDALAGQLRAAADVSVDQPIEAVAGEHKSLKPWRSEIRAKFMTILANLNLRSTACRHAVRLAVCVVAGEALGRGLNYARPYWIPMTIAIVLKPDFGGTFQRGVLRLGGTYLGLVLATASLPVVPNSVRAHIVAVGISMFVIRCFGPANYGIVATAVSALVVFLFSLTGIAPMAVIGARAINTSIGGAIALLAYWLWPTWERYRVSDVMAEMLDAFREYLDALQTGERIEAKRIAGRLARSNLEASIDRAASEPGVSPDRIALLNGMMATSRRLAKSLLSLEASRGALSKQFATDLEATLSRLAQALRTSKFPDLPDLREEYHKMIQSADKHSLVNVEADRIVNSLNTLAEQVQRWIA